jgi:tetratricopeptide (TPR) repeat protein
MLRRGIFHFWAKCLFALICLLASCGAAERNSPAQGSGGSEVPPKDGEKSRQFVLEPLDEETGVLLEDAQKLRAARRPADAQAKYRAALDRIDEKTSPFQAAGNLILFALCAREKGHPEEGVEAARRAVKIHLETLGESHPETLTSMNILALLLMEEEKLSESEPIYRKVLDLRKKVLGEKDLATQYSMLELGSLLARRGKFGEAERLLGQLLDGLRLSREEEHPLTLAAMNGFAVLLQGLGRYREAEPLLRKVYEVNLRKPGEGARNTLISGNNLGNLLLHRGKYREAEPLLRRIYDLRRQVLVEAHTDTLDSMNSLASALGHLGRLPEAEALYVPALEASRKSRGEEDPRTITLMNNLASLLQDAGRSEEAMVLYRRALEIQRRALGGKDLGTAAILHNLATLLRSMGQLAEAERCCRTALEIRLRALDDEHPAVLTSMNNLAIILKAQGNLREAKELYGRVYDVRRRIFGEESRDTASALNNLGICVWSEGRTSEAEGLLRRSLDLYRSILGEEHPAALNTMGNLATLLLELGRPGEAEALFSRALSGAEHIRARVLGDERDRGLQANVLRLAHLAAGHAGSLIRLGRPLEAFDASERGRARGLLDLLARADRDLIGEARRLGSGKAAAEIGGPLAAEEEATIRLRDEENLLAATANRGDLKAEEKEVLLRERRGAVRAAEEARRAAERKVLRALAELIPEGKPSRHEEVRAALERGEWLLSYVWSDESVSLVAMPPREADEVEGWIIAEGLESVESIQELAGEFRSWLASPEGGAGSLEVTGDRLRRFQELGEKILPASIRGKMRDAARILVIPDGALSEIPLEALVTVPGSTLGTTRFFVDDAPPIAYVPSGSVLLHLRSVRKAREGREDRPVSAVVLGGAKYGKRSLGDGGEIPARGALLFKVPAGSSAGKAGLRAGDIILRYGDREIEEPASLESAAGLPAGEAPPGPGHAGKGIGVMAWREGKTFEATVAPGDLGAVLWRGSLAAGLDWTGKPTEGKGDPDGTASALEQIRLYGRILVELPGTVGEAKGIAEIFRSRGWTADVLLGDEATMGKLEASVPGKRHVHLATHGILGSKDRPYEASVALTRPEVYTVEDMGFLTIDRMVRTWRGKLSACDLVLLSACHSGSGVRSGDESIALPWGFLYAGASAVAASLWDVDDATAASFVARFYENLLGASREPRGLGGEHPPGESMGKAEALLEAKLWLRKSAGLPGDREGSAVVGRGEPRPVDPGTTVVSTRSREHPFYWARLIIIGDPE